ncbi:rhomboid family intramembrane serine protease [Jeotgalibaca sp. A127]|uniref:rhomboid family intramembrane serine protease n=1 Tax=Jeotgalibaca sp. A127 TaxID=3457324 RepID=UPI003FD69B94
MRNINFRNYFRKNQPIVTYVFFAIQILVFIVMSFDGGTTNIYTLIKYGANFSPAIISGEWWRFVTPIFIHIGFTHILMNSITLYYLGSQLEWIYGSWRFFLLYLLGGIMGNVMSFGFSASVSAGASTSLFGLFAAAVVLGRIYPHNYTLRSMAQGFLILIVLNFFTGFLSSGIDNWGHFGGAIGGALAAFFIDVPNLAPVANSTRLKAALGYIALLVMFIVIGFMRFK